MPADPGSCLRIEKGWSLIELMVGLTIVGVGLMVGAPSFSGWMQNTQIRTAAESIQAGLNLARSEAIRRNTPVRFQLVDTLTNSCVLSTSGTNWVVNVGSSISPAAQCDSTPGSSASPYLVQASPAVSSNSLVTVAAGQPTISFDGLGRQIASTNPSVPVDSLIINIGNSAGACLAASGTLRCLRLMVSTLGQIRMCDPSVTSTTNNSPTAC